MLIPFIIGVPSFIGLFVSLRWLFIFNGKFKALLSTFFSAALCGITVRLVGVIWMAHQ